MGSMSIPIHISNLSANDVGFVDTTVPQKPKKEIITDELSTVLDAKVTITPNFDVKVEGGQMPDQDLEFDDEEDKEIEQAENDYLKRNAEHEGEENDGEKEESE